MKTKIVITIFLFTGIIVMTSGFMDDNPYFRITAEDVTLKVPAGFPRPLYNFKTNRLTPEIFTLGRTLFYDKLLSKDNSVSCGSCHQRIAAFAHIDHALSHGIYAKIGTRNVPALQNLIWKDAYMWDGGVNNLEIQPLSPITNPIEMDETLENVISKLKHDKKYVMLFQNAFHDTIIDSKRLLQSIAQFTGLMISGGSRYDRFLEGKDTFSGSEMNGLKLFRSKCENCHKEPLFTNNSYRNNGLKPDPSLKDEGRAKITGKEEDRYRFQVPGLRNIEMTYPYMHDGRFQKLRDVVNHYSNPKNFDNRADRSLQKIGYLTDREKDELVAFLLTLTDKAFLYDRRFADPDFQ